MLTQIKSQIAKEFNGLRPIDVVILKNTHTPRCTKRDAYLWPIYTRDRC